MRTKISIALLSILLFANLAAPAAAQTVIPEPDQNGATVKDCNALFYTAGIDDLKTRLERDPDRKQILACAVMTGRVHLFMIPFFIVYLIEVLVGVAATVTVLFIVIGGFQYATGGLTEEKEKGKKTVMNAVIGLIVVSLSWIVINIIQIAITSGS